MTYDTLFPTTEEELSEEPLLQEHWYSNEVKRRYNGTVRIEEPLIENRLRAHRGAAIYPWHDLPGLYRGYQVSLINRPTPVASGSNEPTATSLNLSVRKNSYSPRIMGTFLGFHAMGKCYFIDLQPGVVYACLSWCPKALAKDAKIKATIHIRILEELKLRFNTFPFDVTLALGARLQSSQYGDVIFHFKGDSRKLHACKAFLSARTSYYARMFTSLLKEGEKGETDSNMDIILRRHVTVDDSFDLLHNVLYYLYTDRIVFNTDPTYYPTSIKEFPKYCPAEDIYAISDRLLLDALKQKAFHFLSTTCTVDNITARTMSQFAMTYTEVGAMYADYLQKNWKEVRLSEAHKQFFINLSEEDDAEEYFRVMQRYRHIMEDPVWKCSR